MNSDLRLLTKAIARSFVLFIFIKSRVRGRDCNRTTKTKRGAWRKIGQRASCAKTNLVAGQFRDKFCYNQ